MLKISREGKNCRVKLFQVNRLNTLFSELVKQQLTELVEESGITVVFDLEDIRFIDSSGFDVLLEVSDRARKAGSQFNLCNITDDVRELIILMELEERFTMVTCENTGEKILLALD
ncbi:MAG: STAS domain-containing protein [Bacteroidales bacterium]|nr:STAS domain-containing protein [Bacteroidales bacterium]